VISCFCLAPLSALAGPSVAVLYPDLNDPYRKVFLEIIRGIETELQQPVKAYLLRSDLTPEAMAKQLKQDRIDVAIALGRAGYVAAKAISGNLPVVIGAVLVAPGKDEEGLSGISLTPDPAILFTRLRELVPQAREVTVIYDPGRKGEEIARARDAAKIQGLAFNALPAADLKLSAALYHKLLMDIKNGAVAIWLPQDSAAMDEQALLPLLLREAWDKSFVVFSSNLDHVRKGALFSLYPDNAGMGRSLAAMARSRLQPQPSRGTTIEPLRDVLMAVNLRTAEHLGLSFAGTALRRFGMTFPPPQ
jgi:putative ABC transport system substrate-binding protein